MAQAKDSDLLHQPPMPRIDFTSTAPDISGPVQVSEATFLAAQLREALTDAANLRHQVAELQVEIVRLHTRAAQVEINRLDKTYGIGEGTVLVGKTDGTFWRVPQGREPS